MAEKRHSSKKVGKILLIFIMTLLILATVGLQACNKNKGGDEGELPDEGIIGSGDPDEGVHDTESPFVGYNNVSDINKYSSKTAVGYAAEYLGTVDRQKPEVSDGGLVASGTISAYPRWGKKVDQRE